MFGSMVRDPRLQPAGAEGLPPPDADRLPGSVLVAQSPPSRSRYHPRAARHSSASAPVPSAPAEVARADGAGRPPARPGRQLSAPVLRRPAAADRHCPGAGAQAPTSSSATSRSLRSTSRCRRRSSTCSPTCSATSACRSSSSRTISAWSHISPSGRGDVSRQDRRDRRPRRRSLANRVILTQNCFSAPLRRRIRVSAGRRRSMTTRTSRPRPSMNEAAVSAHAALWPPTVAGSRSRI